MFDVARIEQLRDEYPINLLKTIAAEKTCFEFNADEITEDKIDGLALSIRAFNNLKKIGCNTVADVVELTEEKILSVKNLGVKTRTEIAIKLVSLGAFNTAWSYYLPKEKK